MKTKCQWCGSENTNKRGKRKTHQGTKQIYWCRDCKAKFTNGNLVIAEVPERERGERKTYAQNWPAYNNAQMQEKLMFLQILSEITQRLKGRRNCTGRPRADLSDILFCCCLKVYSGFSSRRLNSDLEISKQQGYVNKVPHFTTLMKSLGEKELTPALKEVLRISSYPLKEMEKDFAIDSTGFSTSMFSRWNDAKWGKDKSERIWVKCHAMTGTRTNVISSIEITEGHSGDSPQFIPLLKDTTKTFEVREVSADMAYSSRKNLDGAVENGCIPYIPFKSNAKGTAKGSKVWSTMYKHFINNQEEFMQRYHKRSNVESTFSMIKRKFGNNLRTKTLIGNINEILCKAICHNLVVQIHEFEELGIRPSMVYGTPEKLTSIKALLSTGSPFVGKRV